MFEDGGILRRGEKSGGKGAKVYVHGVESRIWKRIFVKGEIGRTCIASRVQFQRTAEEFERRLRSAEEDGDEGKDPVGELNNGCQINGILRPTFLDFSYCETLTLAHSLFAFFLSPFFVLGSSFSDWSCMPGRPPGDIGTIVELPINNWLLNYYRTFQSPRVDRPYNAFCCLRRFEYCS